MDLNQAIIEIQKHIAVLNDDYTAMSNQLAVLGNDVDWLKRFFFMIAVAVIGGLVASIWNLILHKKNGKK
jgi:hypothetical protein|tara:strand:+ start:545 stop:754 length:210 start_codon:yes stop_codon:yes gene_type:complete